MSEAARNPLVVIEDSLLTSMSSNVAFTKEFPFLKGLSPAVKRSCSRCGHRNRDTSTAYNSAKAAIHGLSSVRRAQLKTMLNAKQLRVVYKTAAGKVYQFTF